jgi:Cu(I)/Ag(I) efflux system membrane fusion protein
MEGMDMGEGGVSAPPGRAGEKGDMKGMEGMKGPSVPETRKVAGFSLALTTVPENPKAGNVLLKLTLTDQAGKPVTNAQVVFVYTMPMPGMTDSKVAARHTKEGLYEGTVLFGMGGTWVVTVNVTVPGQPPIAEKFQFAVAGGGM